MMFLHGRGSRVALSIGQSALTFEAFHCALRRFSHSVRQDVIHRSVAFEMPAPGLPVGFPPGDFGRRLREQPAVGALEPDDRYGEDAVPRVGSESCDSGGQGDGKTHRTGEGAPPGSRSLGRRLRD